MRKTERHNKILEIVSTGTIRRQEEIADRLAELGFEVTQASVSRDLEELGIRKQGGTYAPSAEQVSIFGNVAIRRAGDSLVVVRCLSGMASALAVRIDAAAIPSIAGTIAGDDTIFVAVDGKSAQTAVIKTLKLMLDMSDRGEQ